MSSTLVESPPLPDAPYRGIEPFRFIDQLLFAARDDETWELLSKVTLYRAMLLYGESGVGKSSLINAGLLPEALNDKYVPNRLRIQPFADREIRVERIIRQDGPTPIYLPSTFRQPNTPNKVSGPDSASFELPLEVFMQQLSEACGRPDSESTDQEEFDDEVIYEWAGPRPLLIFDQFEEFITLFEVGQRSQQSQSSRDELSRLQGNILDALVTLIRDTSLSLKIVFVFREDFLAKLSLLLDHCPELIDQALRLIPPHVSALPKIIRQPFVNPELRAHFKDSTENGTELSEQLAKEIAADLSELSGDHLINLSELQIICLLLWRSTDPEELYRTKRAEGLLKDYAASVVGQFPAEWHDKAVALLAEMLTSSNTRNIVSEADLKATGKKEGLSDHQIDVVLNSLCENQIVRRERHRELYFYELASEYLVSWINERATQREVKKKVIAEREQQRRIEAERNMDRINRLRRLLVILAGIMLLVTTYLAIRSANAEREKALATQQIYESKQQLKVAEEKTRVLEEQRRKLGTTIAPLISSNNDSAKLAALSKIHEWTRQGDLPPEFLLLLLAAQRQSEDKAVKEAAQKAIVEAAQADPEFFKAIDLAVQTDPNLAAKLPLRFNIYLADESQRGTAERISAALRRQGYVVSGAPSVVPNPPKWDSEVRYFTPPQQGQKQPGELINLLKSLSRTNWRPAYSPKYSKSAGGSSGQIELWFAVPSGHLDLGFVDEGGKPITGVKPSLVNFVCTGGPGVSFISKNLSITVPEGEYNVSISVPGYKTLQQPLSIKGGNVIDWKSLKLIRE